MRIDSWLPQQTSRLDAVGIGSARLDCLILLEDATGKDRAWLLAHPEYELPDALVMELDTKVARRQTHLPLAYIRGWTEFYGREFYVDEHVLEPRPESETMINVLKGLALPEQPVVVDVGTGSGALAITAALELPASEVYGIDTDPGCLTVARRNAGNLKAHVTWLESDLLSGFEAAPDVVLANLPYVPDNFQINPAAMNEPRLAIFGGPDGLDLYRRMFQDFNERLLKMARPAFVLTEALPPQHGQLAAIAQDNGYGQIAAADFIQAFAPVNS